MGGHFVPNSKNWVNNYSQYIRTSYISSLLQKRAILAPQVLKEIYSCFVYSVLSINSQIFHNVGLCNIEISAIPWFLLDLFSQVFPVWELTQKCSVGRLEVPGECTGLQTIPGLDPNVHTYRTGQDCTYSQDLPGMYKIVWLNLSWMGCFYVEINLSGLKCTPFLL